MMDWLKKALLLGLGTASVTREKIEETMNKLVEQGKLSSEEAERVTQEMVQTGEKEFEEIRNEVDKGIQSAISKMNLAGQDDLEDIRQRVEHIEERLKHLEQKLDT